MARIDDGFKRACIYFFYDGQGIVDDYIPYLLDDLMENVDELVVVCNGKLTDDGRNKFARYGKVIERANEGLDVYAYKAGMNILDGTGLRHLMSLSCLTIQFSDRFIRFLRRLKR